MFLIPLNLCTEDMASYIVNPFTVVGMIDTVKAKNEKVFINTAAASQLGQMLAKFCPSQGVTVVSLVRRQEQKDMLSSLGAEHVVVQNDGWQAELRTLIEKMKIKIAFDCIGGEMTGTLLSLLPNKSTVYVYGLMSGEAISKVEGLDVIVNKKQVKGWLLHHYLLGSNPLRLLYRMKRCSDLVKSGMCPGGWSETQFEDVSMEGMWARFLQMSEESAKGGGEGCGFTGKKLRISLDGQLSLVSPLKSNRTVAAVDDAACLPDTFSSDVLGDVSIYTSATHTAEDEDTTDQRMNVEDLLSVPPSSIQKQRITSAARSAILLGQHDQQEEPLQVQHAADHEADALPAEEAAASQGASQETFATSHSVGPAAADASVAAGQPHRMKTQGVSQGSPGARIISSSPGSGATRAGLVYRRPGLQTTSSSRVNSPTTPSLNVRSPSTTTRIIVAPLPKPMSTRDAARGHANPARHTQQRAASKVQSGFGTRTFMVSSKNHARQLEASERDSIRSATSSTGSLESPVLLGRNYLGKHHLKGDRPHFR